MVFIKQMSDIESCTLSYSEHDVFKHRKTNVNNNNNNNNDNSNNNNNDDDDDDDNDMAVHFFIQYFPSIIRGYRSILTFCI